MNEDIEVVWHAGSGPLVSSELDHEGIDVRRFPAGYVAVDAWRGGAKVAGYVVDASAEDRDAEIETAIEKCRHRLVRSRTSNIGPI